MLRANAARLDNTTEIDIKMKEMFNTIPWRRYVNIGDYA